MFNHVMFEIAIEKALCLYGRSQSQCQSSTVKWKLF